MFEKAAKILHKKYTASGSFRNLVKPVMASGFSTGAEQVVERRSTSFNLNSNKLTPNKKKGCC